MAPEPVGGTETVGIAADAAAPPALRATASRAIPPSTVMWRRRGRETEPERMNPPKSLQYDNLDTTRDAWQIVTLG